MIVGLILAAFVAALAYFSDELDAGRHDLACPRGRRKMKSVLITSEAQVAEIESGLAANCPWCLTNQQQPAKGKGVDVHA